MALPRQLLLFVVIACEFVAAYRPVAPLHMRRTATNNRMPVMMAKQKYPDKPGPFSARVDTPVCLTLDGPAGHRRPL